MKEFNLIATTEMITESEASSRLWILLRAAGDEAPSVDRSGIRGVIVARTSLGPVEAIRRLREELKRQPQGFRPIYRVIPVETIVPTDLGKIAEAAQELAFIMGEEDSFRITVEKRRTGLGSREVIEAAAEGIDRRVDLEAPDWVVLIEIMGRVTGVSVVRPEDVLNVQKERPPLPPEGEEGPPLDDEHG